MDPVSFHPLAQRESDEAIRYSDEESPGLGDACLDEVTRCLERIVGHPEAGNRIRSKVRRRLVRRFPFALLYWIERDEIRILAVMNLSRRPTYWTRRL